MRGLKRNEMASFGSFTNGTIRRNSLKMSIIFLSECNSRRKRRKNLNI